MLRDFNLNRAVVCVSSAATTSILRPRRSTCVSRHPRFRT